MLQVNIAEADLANTVPALPRLLQIRVRPWTCFLIQKDERSMFSNRISAGYVDQRLASAGPKMDSFK